VSSMSTDENKGSNHFLQSSPQCKGDDFSLPCSLCREKGLKCGPRHLPGQDPSPRTSPTKRVLREGDDLVLDLIHQIRDDGNTTEDILRMIKIGRAWPPTLGMP